MGEQTSDYFIVEDSESLIDYVPNFEDAEHARSWLDAVDVFIEKHSAAEAAAPARKQSACIRIKLPELAILEEEMKSREEPVYAGHSGIYRKPNPKHIDYSEINALKTELRFLLQSLENFLEQIREWRENKPSIPKSRGRRATVKYKGDATIEYKGNEYKMAKNKDYTNVSEKIYEHCQEVGKVVSAQCLFEAVKNKSYESDRITNWNWLYQAIRSANRWADRKKLPQLFMCEVTGVTRLI